MHYLILNLFDHSVSQMLLSHVHTFGRQGSFREVTHSCEYTVWYILVCCSEKIRAIYLELCFSNCRLQPALKKKKKRNVVKNCQSTLYTLWVSIVLQNFVCFIWYVFGCVRLCLSYCSGASA